MLDMQTALTPPCIWKIYVRGACMCAPGSFESLWISFPLQRAATSLRELGTWRDNRRSCHLCWKCQRRLAPPWFCLNEGRHAGEGPQSPFKLYACVCSGIFGGLSHCYYGNIPPLCSPLSSSPHPLQLLPWPYAWSFLKRFSLLSHLACTQ